MSLERDWKDFAALHAGEAGARAAFEKACETLLRKCYPAQNVQQVEIHQGDGGIDIMVGDFAKAIDVYQCKYFSNVLGDAQKAQIARSFTTAITNDRFSMASWTLCLPKLLNLDEHQWWAKWKQRMEVQYQLAGDFIRFKNGNELIDLMKEHNIYNAIFKIAEAERIEAIYEMLQAQHVPVDRKQVEDINTVNSLLDPHAWKLLHSFRISYQGLLSEKDLVSTECQKLMKGYIPYVSIRAANNIYRKTIANILYKEDQDEKRSFFDFFSNDPRFIYELSEVFLTEDKTTLRETMHIELGSWHFARKAAFVNSASLEIIVDPDMHRVSINNAPIYEGEPTDNNTILNDVLVVNKRSVEHMQQSLGKVLGFWGRLQVCQQYCLLTGAFLKIVYELNNDLIIAPHFLRLLCNILEGTLSPDLFRVSVHNNETWDYVYQPV